MGDLVGVIAGAGDRPIVFEGTSGTIVEGRTGATPSAGRREAATRIQAISGIGGLKAVYPRFGAAVLVPEATVPESEADEIVAEPVGAALALEQQELGLGSD